MDDLHREMPYAVQSDQSRMVDLLHDLLTTTMRNNQLLTRLVELEEQRVAAEEEMYALGAALMPQADAFDPATDKWARSDDGRYQVWEAEHDGTNTNLGHWRAATPGETQAINDTVRRTGKKR